ncbi:hypothetical protein ABZ927_22290 [Streptomyces massasporeus]
MPDHPDPKVLASAGVVLSAATGVVINLITSQPSWSLAAALAVLVIAAIVIAAWSTGSPRGRSRVHQRATRNGHITGSGVTARDGAFVGQKASRRGRITDSPVTSRGADTDQSATRGGDITNSPIEADQ